MAPEAMLLGLEAGWDLLFVLAELPQIALTVLTTIGDLLNNDLALALSQSQTAFCASPRVQMMQP